MGALARGSRPPASRRAGAASSSAVCTVARLVTGLDAGADARPPLARALSSADGGAEHHHVGAVQPRQRPEQRPRGRRWRSTSGTISPITRWRKTTIAQGDDEADAVEQRPRGRRPKRSSADSTRWASAGSATAPSPSDAMVMPSWLPASWRLRSSTASRATRRARRSPRFGQRFERRPAARRRGRTRRRRRRRWPGATPP